VFGLRNRGTEGTAPRAGCYYEGIEVEAKEGDSCPYDITKPNGLKVLEEIEVLKEKDFNSNGANWFSYER
jgi:hypothetical protein